MLKKAILIVHGFAGGTYDEEYLQHRLELISEYDVFSFTLPGHDGLFKPNMKEQEWIKSAENMMDFLIQNNYKTIYVVGHSMGGVIATHLANKYEEVKKIVLVAAAFKFAGFDENNFKIINSLKKTPQIMKDYPKDEVITRFLKMPLSAVKEFASLVRNNEKNLNTIEIPTLVIQGNNDAIVPLETADFIYNTIPSKEKEILICDRVTHDVFRGEKKDEITKEIIEFLKK